MRYADRPTRNAFALFQTRPIAHRLSIRGDAHALDCHANAATAVAVIRPVTPNRVVSPRHVYARAAHRPYTTTLMLFGLRGNDRRAPALIAFRYASRLARSSRLAKKNDGAPGCEPWSPRHDGCPPALTGASDTPVTGTRADQRRKADGNVQTRQVSNEAGAGFPAVAQMRKLRSVTSLSLAASGR